MRHGVSTSLGGSKGRWARTGTEGCSQLPLSFLVPAADEEELQPGPSQSHLALPCPLHTAYRPCSVTSQWQTTTARSGLSHCMTLTTVGESPER